MDEDVRWMARLLEASLQSSGLSEREIEERLAWEPGALGRVLDGSVDCGPQQLLAILAELGAERAGTPPFPRRPERGADMVQELIERFRGLGYGQPAGAAAIDATLPSAGEIEKTVDDVLGRTFGNFGKGRRGGS